SGPGGRRAVGGAPAPAAPRSEVGLAVAVRPRIAGGWSGGPRAFGEPPGLRSLSDSAALDRPPAHPSTGEIGASFAVNATGEAGRLAVAPGPGSVSLAARRRCPSGAADRRDSSRPARRCPVRS